MAEIFPEALEHFRSLLRMDTTNPPGNEKEAILYINQVLNDAGLRPQIIESSDRRANLVVRLKGDQSQRPLLITSHVDVVHAETEKWKYPPFSGTVAEDCIWGRGAVDMKNMTTYCLSTILALHREGVRLKRDVIMSAVADEEVGGDYGMGFLTKKFPELLNAEYALGELGGYTVHIGGKRIYPVQVGEKGIFWIKIRFTGQPGHGSVPREDNSHFKAARFIEMLRTKNLPPHTEGASTGFFKGMAGVFGPVKGIPYRLILSPMGPKILKKFEKTAKDPEIYAALRAMISHTANPTGMESGRQHNVVPSTVIVKLDCRILPGYKGSDLIAELEKMWGEKLDVEVIREASGYQSPFDTPLFDEMKKQISVADPGCHVLPNLTVGFTDAQYLNKIGVICYGFTPVKLPPEISFPKLYHAHNERIPVEGFKWGLDVFHQTVRNFCMKSG
jgi:acetylornithine deacetylase/succinyl-diaminopimelate desuccinylase-like protein